MYRTEILSRLKNKPSLSLVVTLPGLDARRSVASTFCRRYAWSPVRLVAGMSWAATADRENTFCGRFLGLLAVMQLAGARHLRGGRGRDRD